MKLIIIARNLQRRVIRGHCRSIGVLVMMRDWLLGRLLPGTRVLMLFRNGDC